MSTGTPALTSFTSGELSPKLAGRIDIKYYAQGCQSLVNFLNMPHGGVMRRSGFRFVHEAGNQDSPSLLVPFEYNTEQAYILEFFEGADGHGKMRVFKDQGVVVSSPGVPYEISIPFEPEDFAELRWVQNNNTLYFAHPSYAPRTLTRSSHTSWIFATPTFLGQPEEWTAANYPSLVCFFESRLCYAATPAQPNTLWFSQTNNFEDFRLNTREVPLTNWATCTIADGNSDGKKDGKANDTFLLPKNKIFSSNDVDLVSVKGTTPGGDSRYFRYIGEKRFDAGTSADKTITFKDSGLTGDQIESIYSSAGALQATYWEAWEVGDRRSNEQGDPRADDAIEITLAAAQPQSICWLLPKDRLWIGTASATWTLGASSATEGMSPDNVKASQHSNCGSAVMDPVGINSSTLFVQRGQKKLREMAYDFNTDSYVTPDKTILSDHILEGRADRVVYVQDPDSVIYAMLADGDLRSMTYMPEQDVQGWSNVVTDGTFESIASIFGTTDDRTELWAQTVRTIDGTSKRFIEFMEGPHEGDTTADAFFVDCGVSYSGTATDIVTGADHLAGEAVQVLVDGAVHPDVVVAHDGTITLEREGTQIQAGLAYESRLVTMPLEFGSDRGTSQGKRKMLSEMTVRFWRTLGGKVGLDDSRLETIKFRSTSDDMDAPPPLFTGDKTVAVPKGWTREAKLVVVQDQPLPMTLLMMVPTVTANE